MRRYGFLILLMAFFAGCGSSEDAQKSETSESKESPVKGTSDAEPYTAKWYIDQYKGFAIEEMKRTGIPASITLAQGMLESSYGKSELSKEGKNHFGIKCHRGEWGGGKMYLEDDAPNECFRTYNSVLHSYEDHSRFLKGSSRYDFLFEYKPTAYKKWANGLQKAGYATNPNYSKILIRLVERYDLDYFDQFHDEPFEEEKTEQLANKKASKDKDGEKLKSGVFRKNGLKAVKAKSGQTLNDIAAKNDLSKQKLLEYNDLTGKDEIRTGMLLYLEPKRDKTDISYHVVEKGETMHAIAQQYGLKLEQLYKRNRMKEGQQPAVNERLFLRERRYTKPEVREVSPKEEKQGKQVQSKTSAEKQETGNRETDRPNVHTVKQGETMKSIADRYNMALQTLYKRNRMDEGEQPAKGAEIHLETRRYIKPELREKPVDGDTGQQASKTNSQKRGADQSTANKKDTAAKAQSGKSGEKAGKEGQKAEAKKDKAKTPSKPEQKKPEKGGDSANKLENKPPSSSAKAEAKSSEVVDSHTVKAGESLYAIAQKYQVSITQIKEWNGLESDNLDIGQALQVRASRENEEKPEKGKDKPLTDTTPQSHKVQTGETLYSISKQYQIPVSKLKSLNDLDGNNLKIGQKLKLKAHRQNNEENEKEANAENGPKIHKVEQGETLYSIAREYELPVDRIKEANALESAELKIGQELQIPQE